MLKNYKSGAKKNAGGVKFSFDKIQKVLIDHNAKSINYEYKEGRTIGLIFVLEVKGADYGFKLPARIENVEAIFKKEGIRYDPEQPYRTAWANLRDWIDAQMALIDTEQAKIEEVFLPYLVVDTKNGTLFEKMEENGFKQIAFVGPVEGQLLDV